MFKEIRRASVLVLLPALLQCAALSKLATDRPTISYQSAELTNFTLEYVEIKMVLKLGNPYPVKLPAGAVAGDLSMDGTVISKITTTTPEVAANGSAPFPVSFRVPFSAVYSIVGYETKETFDFRFVGNADIKTGVNAPPGVPDRFSVPVDVTQKVPAVIPEFTFANAQVTPPSLMAPNPKLAFDLGVKNRARGKFNLGGINYQIFVGNTSVLNGVTKELTNTGTAAVARVESTLSIVSVPFALLQNTRNMKAKGGTSISFPGFADGRSFPLQFEKSLSP